MVSLGEGLKNYRFSDLPKNYMDENLIFFCCIRRLLLKTVVVEADDVVGCWSF